MEACKFLCFLSFFYLTSLSKKIKVILNQFSEIWSCIIGKCKENFEKTNCICQDTDHRLETIFKVLSTEEFCLAIFINCNLGGVIVTVFLLL